MEKKLSLTQLPLHLRESLDKRARGESKTFDTELIATYLSSLGFVGIWFGAAKDQIEQPKKYLKWIIENSYLKYLIIPGELLKEKVEFTNGGSLKLKNLTEMNARSSRADFIVYDEEAQADKDAYNAAINILAGSSLGMIFHISTPTKASVFEENHDRLKRRQIIHNEQFIFSHTWEDASWLRVKSDWYDEQRKILPDWYFRQEHEAEFTLALGAVFKNVDFSSYSPTILENQRLCSGIDWNPVSGHWLASVKWTPDFKHVYVMEEHPLGNGYTHEMTMEQYNTIKRYYMYDNSCTVEEGGINEAYVKWLKEREADNSLNVEKHLHYEEWDAQGINKLQAVTYLMQNGVCIHCDRQRFPTLTKMIEDCSWDPEATEVRLLKDRSNSPHALDAFLHAISKLNRMDNVVEFGRFY